MKKSPSDKLLRIPVRFIEGHWECEYGGGVPVREGAEGELIINHRSITGDAFLARMRTKSSIKVLDQGVKLLAYLATKTQEKLSDELKTFLIPLKKMEDKIAMEHIDNWNSGGLSLVEVTIGGPTSQQARKFETKNGGLWLLTEGPKAVGLQSTQIHLPKPVSDLPVESLNHAFTRLSETYEPWRISHTGNVYQRFLYEEKDGRWYPLQLLRDAAEAKTEQKIAYQLWQDFMNRASEET